LEDISVEDVLATAATFLDGRYKEEVVQEEVNVHGGAG
jgi:hypothetical protein